MLLSEAKRILKKHGCKLYENYSEDQINSAVDKIERAIYEFKQKGNDYFDVFVDDVYSAISEYVYVDDDDDEWDDED